MDLKDQVLQSVSPKEVWHSVAKASEALTLEQREKLEHDVRNSSDSLSTHLVLACHYYSRPIRQELRFNALYWLANNFAAKPFLAYPFFTGFYLKNPAHYLHIKQLWELKVQQFPNDPYVLLNAAYGTRSRKEQQALVLRALTIAPNDSQSALMIVFVETNAKDDFLCTE